MSGDVLGNTQEHEGDGEEEEDSGEGDGRAKRGDEHYRGVGRVSSELECAKVDREPPKLRSRAPKSGFAPTQMSGKNTSSLMKVKINQPNKKKPILWVSSVSLS